MQTILKYLLTVAIQYDLTGLVNTQYCCEHVTAYV
jgi:hypothetical protein